MILCRDLRIATEIAAHGKFDCVTTEGDQASSKGWLKGGHYVSSKSPMKMQQDKTELIQKMDSIRKELSTLSKEIKTTDSDITKCISASQHAETKRNNAKETYGKLQYDLENIKEQLRILENKQILERKNLEELQSDLSNLQTLRQKLVEELGQDLNDQLTEDDEQQIGKLNESLKQLRKELKGIFTKRKSLEKDKIDYENKLSKNLNCRKKELKRKLQEIGLEESKAILQELEYQFKIIVDKIEKCKSDLEQNEKKYKDANTQRQDKLGELERLYAELKPEQQEFEEKSKEIERLSSKIRILDGNIENTTRKIIELGPLSNNDLYTRYRKKDTKALYKKLDDCRKNLKNYEHVNKKALDQYELFKDQRDNLFKRKEELDRASKKIQELFDFLQQKKYEAVQFTFKQVSKYFTDIFSKIVPRGKAKLVMQQGNSQRENDSTSTNSLDLDNLIGIGIRVSFTGQSSAMIEYNQLSGGQKSLVALTLIFAIQKCDPAPFYLFDEIDGDLDIDHRRLVAQMIHELSSNAQFIIITHRPELLELANQFYGVIFQNNKISSIFEVSREEALEFIEADDE